VKGASFVKEKWVVVKLVLTHRGGPRYCRRPVPRRVNPNLLGRKFGTKKIFAHGKSQFWWVQSGVTENIIKYRLWSLTRSNFSKKQPVVYLDRTAMYGQKTVKPLEGKKRVKECSNPKDE